MDHQDEHIGIDLPKGIKEDFVSQTEIPFERSKEDVWDSLSGKLDDEPASKTRDLRLPPMLYVAASLAVLIATITLYMRFHSIELTTTEEIAEITLPDGSSIEARANSQVSYHPLWWSFNRQVKLEGEAYFDVESGKRFSVVSPQGITEVLGTTFTVIDRSEQYKVSCFSGSVSVQASSKDVAATLLANEEVILDEQGNYNVRLIPEPGDDDNNRDEEYFVFNANLIIEVFKQVEDSYNIHIVLTEDLDHIYSGKLSKELAVRDLLTAICMPLGLNYEQTSDNTYIIAPE